MTPSALTRRRLILLTLGLMGAGCARRDGRTLLRYMAWGNPEQLALEQEIASRFEAQSPGVRVQLFLVPGSAYADKLQLMLASRTAPDVMRADHYYFPALARKNYFLPLDGFVAGEKPGFLDDFVAPALEECKWQGKLYALNVLFGPMIVYYNKTLFAQAGLPNPYDLSRKGKWDWAAFVRAAQALTKTEGGRAAQFGTNMVGFPMYSSVVWNKGGDFMNAGLSRMTLGDNPESIGGLRDYADLRWKYHCAPTPADSALSAFTFESGKIAMNWGWAGDSPRYRKNIKKFEWDIAPLPSGPHGDWSVVKGNQLTINRDTPHPELAWKYVKYMTSPETEMLLCGKMRRAVPTRLSVQRDPAYLHTDKPPFHTNVFLEATARGKTLPINWRYNEWVVTYNAATEGLFNVGDISAAQASRDATARVNDLLASEEGF